LAAIPLKSLHQKSKPAFTYCRGITRTVTRLLRTYVSNTERGSGVIQNNINANMKRRYANTLLPHTCSVRCFLVGKWDEGFDHHEYWKQYEHFDRFVDMSDVGSRKGPPKSRRVYLNTSSQLKCLPWFFKHWSYVKAGQRKHKPEVKGQKTSKLVHTKIVL